MALIGGRVAAVMMIKTELMHVVLSTSSAGMRRTQALNSSAQPPSIMLCTSRMHNSVHSTLVLSDQGNIWQTPRVLPDQAHSS